jgi:hypothetical protein
MLYISSPDRWSELIFGIPTLSHTEISDFWEALLLALFVTEHLTDTETRNILRPHQWPHTQIHPQCDLVP